MQSIASHRTRKASPSHATGKAGAVTLIERFGSALDQNIHLHLLVFPDEGHWILKLANSLQWHEAIYEWPDRYLGASP